MNRRLRMARWGAGVAAAGLAALAIGVATPHAAVATPEEDCQAVRDRDHQIWLQLIANLPPGAPIPPEPINPCIPQPQHTTTAAPAPLPDLPGNNPGQAGSGPQVGVNAPTRMPTYNGTDIVPVPGLPTAPDLGSPPATRSENGSVTAPTVTHTPTSDRTPAPTAEPATVSTPVAPDPESGHAPGPSGTPEIVDTDEPSGTPHTLLLLLTGLAGTVAGATRFGRRPRTPESVLAQAVGAAAAPIMRYTPGQTSRLVVPEEFGLRTLFLIHDESSLHEAVIDTPPVPDGGTIGVNTDGTASILDADGYEVSRMAAPWAYDTNGQAVPTRYVVRDGHLIQQVHADADTAYPILADPEDEQRKKPRNANKQTNSGWSTGQDTGGGRYFSGDQVVEIQKNAQNTSNTTSGAAELMSQAQNATPTPPLAETGTGSPVIDQLEANRTGQPVTSGYGDHGDVTVSPSRTPAGSRSVSLSEQVCAAPYNEVDRQRDLGIVNTLGPDTEESAQNRMAAAQRLADYVLANTEGPGTPEFEKARADARDRQDGYGGDFNGYLPQAPIASEDLEEVDLGEAVKDITLNGATAVGATGAGVQKGLDFQQTQGARAAFTFGQDITPSAVERLERLAPNLNKVGNAGTALTLAVDLKDGVDVPEAVGKAAGTVSGGWYGAGIGAAYGASMGGPWGP